MIVAKPLLGELLSLPHLYYLLRREDNETLYGDIRTTLRRESGPPGLIWGTWAHMRRMGTHGILVHTMGTPVLWGIRNFFIYYVLILKTVRPLYLTVLKSSNILLSPLDKYETRQSNWHTVLYCILGQTPSIQHSSTDCSVLEWGLSPPWCLLLPHLTLRHGKNELYKLCGVQLFSRFSVKFVNFSSKLGSLNVQIRNNLNVIFIVCKWCKICKY